MTRISRTLSKSLEDGFLKRISNFQNGGGFRLGTNYWRPEKIKRNSQGVHMAESTLIASHLPDGIEAYNINFNRSVIRNCKLLGSYAKDCYFGNCDLRWTDFRGSDFINTNFENSDLRWADFRGCNLSNCNFSGCNFGNQDDFLVPTKGLTYRQEDAARKRMDDKKTQILLEYLDDWGRDYERRLGGDVEKASCRNVEAKFHGAFIQNFESFGKKLPYGSVKFDAGKEGVVVTDRLTIWSSRDKVAGK